MQTFRHILKGAMLLAALTLAVPAVQAGNDASTTRTLEKTLAVTADTHVAVENLAGEVSVVKGGSQFELVAHVVAAGKDETAARALAQTVRLDVSRDGSQVTVHVHYPVDQHDRYQYIPTRPSARRHGWRFLGFTIGHSSSNFTYQGRRVSVYQGKATGVPLHVDLELRVPAGLNVHIDNHMGRMHARQVDGQLSMRTGSGDIDASGIHGALTARSGSGDIAVDDVSGPTRVNTGSGDVKLRGVKGDTTVYTGSGDIKGGGLDGGRQQLQTGSGDITLDGLAGDLKVQTGSGDIGLSGLSAIRQASIGSGSGDIRLGGDLSGLEQFRISSGSGDITLASARPPAVHLEIRGSDIGVHWAGLSNVESGRRRFRADVGQATGSGRINTGSGDVALR